MQCITWYTLSLYKYQWARTHQIHQQSTELIVITTRGNSSLCTIIWHMFFDIPYHFSLLYSCFLFSCTHVGASIPSYLISPWQSRGLIGPRLGQRGTVALLVQEAMVRICNGDIYIYKILKLLKPSIFLVFVTKVRFLTVSEKIYCSCINIIN